MNVRRLALSVSVRRRALSVSAVCLLMLLVAGGSVALGAPNGAAVRGAPAPTPEPRALAGMFGVVLAARDGAARPHRPTPSDAAGTRFASGSNLVYHNGPVMHADTNYAIYWEPPGSTVSANYQPLLNRFFTDVGAASGSATNVFATDTQYFDSFGSIAYNSGFGGSYVDTTAIPDHCSSEYSGTGVTVSGCVLDSDVQAAVSRALVATGWQPGPGSMFFVFTPRNVGSCFDSTSGACAYTYYCAYHSNFGSVLYANQPYTDTSGVGAPGACDSGQHPNGDWADATINVVSHEQNETITDPDGSAWYDSSGNEIGDKCAWNFGSTLGSTSYGAYNQVINGDFYYLQQEWSNASSSCVLRYSPPAPAPTISGFSPAGGTVGTTSVLISGTNLTGASAVKFNGAVASFTVTSATLISATVPSAATTGPISVTTGGGTATSATSFTVLPSISGFSPANGPVGSKVTISGGGFSSVTAVKFNGTAASFTVTSATSISATVPSGATSGLIAVTTAAGSAQSATNFTVSVSPDFSLSVSPGSQTVSRGGRTSYTVTITRLSGFSSSVQLSVGGLPSRTSASLSPNPATTSSTLTISTSSRTARGTYTLTVTGTSGSLKHTYQVSLTVQ